MKKYLLSAAALAVMCSTASFAEDSAPGHDGPPSRERMGGMDGKRMEPPKTRQEAIAYSKEFTANLEKMSDDEWKKKHEERQSRREKWKEASPEDREKMKDKFKEMRDKKKTDGAGAAGDM